VNAQNGWLFFISQLSAKPFLAAACSCPWPFDLKRGMAAFLASQRTNQEIAAKKALPQKAAALRQMLSAEIGAFSPATGQSLVTGVFYFYRNFRR
jgi:hypothetical protein